MKPPPFAYHRVGSGEEAVRLLGELGPDAKVLAGGQSLLPLLAFRLARPEHLVDLGTARGLSGVRVDASGLRLGALTTHFEVETCTLPEVLAGWPVLPRTMRLIGHLPIRTRGTVGGSVSHGDGLAEWVLLTLLLDAAVVVLGPAGVREVAASDFYLGLFTTVLAADEIVVAVQFPDAAPHAAVEEYARRRGDYAIVAAGVRLDVDRAAPGSGRPRVLGGRVVVAGAGATGSVPVRVPEAERLLAQADQRTDPEQLFAAVAREAAACVEVVDGPDGDAAYRRALVATLVERAARRALEGR